MTKAPPETRKTGVKIALFGSAPWVRPRGRVEYMDLDLSDLCRRISDDLDEVVARCDPKTEEWRGAASHTRADYFKKGLWERFQSPDKKIQTNAFLEYQRFVEKQNLEEPRDAVKLLAHLGKRVAASLEKLSETQPELIRAVAGASPQWPVNIGREKAGRIRRVASVQKHLNDIGLNKEGLPPSGFYITVSPFTQAAQSLYDDLNLLKLNPSKLAARSWTRRLKALKTPMSSDNASEWWSVAKIWVDEEWEQNRDSTFGPLIEYSKLSTKEQTPSTIKREVVDDRLKKAFKSLAKPR